MPIIGSDGWGWLAYDFRYPKDNPPLIFVNYEGFDLPGDQGFMPAEYVSDSFENLLLAAERQDRSTGALPSQELPIDPLPGQEQWEAQRDQWLSEIHRS